MVFTILGYDLRNESFGRGGGGGGGKSGESRETLLLILRNETSKKNFQCRATATLKNNLENEHKLHTRFETNNFWLTHNGQKESSRTFNTYNGFSVLTRERKLARR